MNKKIRLEVIQETLDGETRYKVVGEDGMLWWGHHRIAYPSAVQIGKAPLCTYHRADWLKWTSKTPEQALLDHAPLHETDEQVGINASKHYQWVVSAD